MDEQAFRVEIRAAKQPGEVTKKRAGINTRHIQSFFSLCATGDSNRSVRKIRTDIHSKPPPPSLSLLAKHMLTSHKLQQVKVKDGPAASLNSECMSALVFIFH